MVSTPPEHILPLNVLSLPKQIHSIKVTFAVFELFTLLAISVISLFIYFFILMSSLQTYHPCFAMKIVPTTMSLCMYISMYLSI